ncbi:MAG: hypothetical protein AMS14_10675 [Planctomycetes bacterium DG_20]|nr:MAG: hypothetical protein AMS14_10675 [Planctomycetes bacterium DG_20]
MSSAAARWALILLAATVCLTATCVGAALGWLGAALYQVDLGEPQASPQNLAGTLWGAASGVAAGLVWSAAMTLLTRRAIRQPHRAFSAGATTFLGLALGCLAGALGTAILHAGLTLAVFPSRAEAAVWFLAMLLGVPAGGMGGLAAGLVCAALIRAFGDKAARPRVNLTV